MRERFISAINDNQSAYGIELDAQTVVRLADHYDLVMEHNPLLHLVGPCEPEEFAVRHVLESLFLLKYLPKGTRLIDIGPGGGFPSIPCLIADTTLKATLIEAKNRKAEFLSSTINTLHLADRAAVVNKQFLEAVPGNATVVTSRALDKFTERLPKLLKWSGKRKVVLFGGESMRDALDAAKHKYTQTLLPMSERRFIFELDQ